MRPGYRFLLIIASWCAWTLPAAAASYQVEIIIFAYAQPDADGEQFATDEGLPDPQGLAMLGGGEGGNGLVVTPLSSASHRLNGVLGALRRGAKYRPLLHASWLQPEASRIRGVWVSAPSTSALTDGPAMDVERVIGSVRLRVSRFLHADMDLAYFPGAAAPGMAGEGGAEPVDHVRLRDSRRIKFNEVHYFDHPLFGALLQVSRAGGEEEGSQE